MDSVLFFDFGVKSFVYNTNPSEHPIASKQGKSFGMMPAFKDVLQKEFSNSLEDFWKKMHEQDADQKLILYCDNHLELSLKIMYWKSIFKNPNADFLLWMQNASILQRRLKSDSFLKNSRIKREEVSSVVPFTTKMEFDELFNSIQPSPYLISIPKIGISFEYLLANYYFDKESAYIDSFKEKLKQLAWKSWYNDLAVYSEEIFHSIYDFKKIFPNLEIEIDMLKPEAYEAALRLSSKTNWLFDSNLNGSMGEAIIKKYDRSVFTDVFKCMFDNVCGQGSYAMFRKNVMLAIDDPVQKTEMLFDRKYEQFLESSMRQEFGSIFATNALGGKSNSSLISFICEKVRTGKTNDLSVLELV